MTPPVKTTPRHLPADIRGWLNLLIDGSNLRAAEVNLRLCIRGYVIGHDSLRKYMARRRWKHGIVGRPGRPRREARNAAHIARAELLSLRLAYPNTTVRDVVREMTKLCDVEGGAP